jgi:phosphosulfolactate synthase
MNKIWGNLAKGFAGSRTTKPRLNGLTMAIDPGYGLYQAEDLVKVSGSYIDQITLALGTSVLYDETLLMQKIELYVNNSIDILPGGNILEIAVWQGDLDNFLGKVKRLGFTAINVSRGTIAMKRKIREDIIEKSQKKDLKVITEIGKKHPEEELSLPRVQELISEDIKRGVFKVALEAEPAKNDFGVMDDEGFIKKENVEFLLKGLDDPDAVLWEVPFRGHYKDFIFHLGINVNLSNVPCEAVLTLEALRQGLIGEKEKRTYLERKYWKTFQDNR